jgi:hypothetical protein
MAANMNFSAALNLLKSGAKCARDGWNGKGLWVEAQYPDEYPDEYPDDHSKMTKPYMVLVRMPATTAESLDRVPWVPSQGDLMADDWRTLV